MRVLKRPAMPLRTRLPGTDMETSVGGNGPPGRPNPEIGCRFTIKTLSLQELSVHAGCGRNGIGHPGRADIPDANNGKEQ